MDLGCLIASVKSRQTLWDQRLTDHHNRFTLDRLWNEVSEDNACTVKDAQSKWKTLRDYYRKEFYKAKEHERRKTVYRTSWPYFELLHFLKDQFTLKRTTWSLKKKEMRNEITSKISEDSIESAIKEEILDDEWNRTLQSDSHEEEISCSGESNNIIHSRILNKNLKRNGSNEDQTFFGTKTRKLPTLEEKRPKREELDEDQSFFESLLPHVRGIKGVNKMHFRNEVQNLIIKYAYLGATPYPCDTNQTRTVEQPPLSLHTDSAVSVSQNWFQEQNRNSSL